MCNDDSEYGEYIRAVCFVRAMAVLVECVCDGRCVVVGCVDEDGEWLMISDRESSEVEEKRRVKRKQVGCASCRINAANEFARLGVQKA
jgi:hypothetical protein